MQTPRIIPASRILRAGTQPGPRRFAAGVTAAAAMAALVLSTALPARAKVEGDDLAKALIAALVIGAIVHETKKKDDPAPVPAPVPAHGSGHDDRHDGLHPERPVIPRVCAIEIEGERRAIQLYPESCLRDEGVGGPLPRDCATRATIFGMPDRVYGADCLRDAGFRLRGGW